MTDQEMRRHAIGIGAMWAWTYRDVVNTTL